MKEIPLTKGYVTVVDDDDYPHLSQFNWQALVLKHQVYATRNLKRDGKWTKIYMHRELMGEPHALVDHRDGNGLRNLRQNLRVCNSSQNCANHGKVRGHSSVFKGLSWCLGRDKWEARVHKDGKSHRTGYFSDEFEAAWAYDDLAMKLHGPFACLNFVALRTLSLPWSTPS